jgi:anti-sigma factor RsiW
MECTAIQNMVFRRIDRELSGSEEAEFDAHLAQCSFCAREYGMFSLTSRVGQAARPPAPSPYFHQKLKLALEGEVQKAAGWQLILHLARQVIPAMAAITLALLSIFAYVQMSGNETDLYGAYNRVFITEDQPNRILIAEQSDITVDSVLRAIADRETTHRRNPDIK